LKLSSIKLGDEEDTLIYSNNPSASNYTTKHGYKAMFSEESKGELVWRWKSIWKIKGQIKKKMVSFVGS
jgi:hypothetical protein